MGAVHVAAAGDEISKRNSPGKAVSNCWGICVYTTGSSYRSLAVKTAGRKIKMTAFL